MTMKMNALMALALIGSLTAWACDSDGTGDAGGSADVTVVAENTRFHPTTIIVPAGEEVSLRLENRDAFDHDLQVGGLAAEVVAGGIGSDRNADAGHGSGGHSDFGTGDGGTDIVAVHTKANANESVTFEAMDTGTYEFYCTLPGHKESGMVGTFIVE